VLDTHPGLTLGLDLAERGIMSIESNKVLVRRYVDEVLNQKNLAVVDELFAPSFVDHDSSMPEAKGADDASAISPPPASTSW
jgi:hypothetical protein